tara:strand:- start:136 stop:1155 length:1020 start_codon:yes stop_codon:yes gene_type:complete
MKICKALGNIRKETLCFYQQIGVEQVNIPPYKNSNLQLRPLVPPPQKNPPGPMPEKWDENELNYICEQVRAFELEPTAIELPISRSILLGEEERSADLEDIIERIHIASRVGLSILTYNFTALRASEGYSVRTGAGRGGTNLRDFDFSRIKEKPPLNDLGKKSKRFMWKNLEYFLKIVVPEAENAGVRLALHPNDPPVPEYRGVAQPVWNAASVEKLLGLIDSPANGLFFDTGVATEWGENVPDLIRKWGGQDRISSVHFRNVRTEKPYYRYVETFIDDGDCDPLGSMLALAEIGYGYGIDPDHTPSFDGDTGEARIGWTLAVTQLRTLRDLSIREHRF